MSRLQKRIDRRRAKRMDELAQQPTSALPPPAISRRGFAHARPSAFITRMLEAYNRMVLERLEEGYEPYLLTFMFSHIPGSATTVAAEMERAIENAYRDTLTLVLRKPNTALNREHPLIWLACPDYPVPKRGKQRLRDVVINDGRHFHVVVLVPYIPSMRRPYDAIVEIERQWFTPPPIFRVDVRHITRTPEEVVAYAFKQLTRRRCGFDDVIYLPRPRAELSGRVDQRWVAARRHADIQPTPRDPWARHRRVLPRTVTRENFVPGEVE